jgi:hypothetical protein
MGLMPSETPELVRDQLMCVVCRGTLSLRHLQAHPFRDDGGELHSLQCDNCGISQNITMTQLARPRAKSA